MSTPSVFAIGYDRPNPLLITMIMIPRYRLILIDTT